MYRRRASPIEELSDFCYLSWTRKTRPPLPDYHVGGCLLSVGVDITELPTNCQTAIGMSIKFIDYLTKLG